jgi:hypothetical protein
MLGGENLLEGCLIVRIGLRLMIPRIQEEWRHERRGG